MCSERLTASSFFLSDPVSIATATVASALPISPRRKHTQIHFTPATARRRTMTITDKVQKKLRTTTSDGRSTVVNIPPRNASKPDQSGSVSVMQEPAQRSGHWTNDEHQRFMLGIEMFPEGPWKEIAAIVLTRNVRQTMTHAQKYWMKIQRHRDGLQRGQSHFQSAGSSSAAATEDDADYEEAADLSAEYEPLDADEDSSFRLSEEEILLAFFQGPRDATEEEF